MNVFDNKLSVLIDYLNICIEKEYEKIDELFITYIDATYLPEEYFRALGAHSAYKSIRDFILLHIF